MLPFLTTLLEKSSKYSFKKMREPQKMRSENKNIFRSRVSQTQSVNKYPEQWGDL